MTTFPCPACEKEVSQEAAACPHCGHPLRSDGAGAIATIIPFKNPPALIAYYCGVFSLIPCLALILGPIAFVCGIVGLRAVKRHPGAKGTAHAWAGIILGGLTTLANAAAVAMLIAAG